MEVYVDNKLVYQNDANVAASVPVDSFNKLTIRACDKFDRVDNTFSSSFEVVEEVRRYLEVVSRLVL
ncbi:MAG: hypothetical protein C4294_18130 [Nitrospiraceae bacterium]